jgi:hypothetical protein
LRPGGAATILRIVARDIERAVVAVVHELYGGKFIATPDWLMRPARAECRRRWPLVQTIYRDLTGGELPEDMPPREHRNVDAVLHKRGHQPRILEVDETQHFNLHRATTLRHYPRSVPTAFPKRLWTQRSDAKTRLEGGGFARPCPPLFPLPGGRHQQRAFRDALADIVPLAHGWQPTLRIADFEVADWIFGADAKRQMRKLLAERL